MYSVPDNAPKEDKAIIDLVNQGMNPERLFKASWTMHSLTTAKELHANGRNTVEGGVYKGMALYPNYIGSMLLPKIIGTYELEVQKMLELQIPHCDEFIDIGCAEGFHLIGVARLLGKTCTGVDINAKCAEAISMVAKLNGVESSVHFCESISKSLRNAKGNILLLIDVDGAETEVLQTLEQCIDMYSINIKSCQIIIESNPDHNGQDNAPLIINLLCSHGWQIKEIQQQKPAYRFSHRLSHLSLLNQIAYGCEGRPARQCWIRATKSLNI